MEKKVLFLNQEDLINSGCLDFDLGLEVVEKALLDFSEKRILYPDKVSQVFDEETQNRINCLPATLIEEKVCGMKWVSVFPLNPQKYGINNVSAVIILSEIECGLPICFMEASMCSALRTASVGAYAARHLAKNRPETIGFVGAGEQAKMHLIALKNLFPSIKKCYVASRTEASEDGFVNTLSEKFGDVEFIKCGGVFERSVTDSDIFVSATSCQRQIIQSDWVKEGSLYIHVGGLEDDFGVPKKADKIVCDSWHSVKHRSQTISRMYQKGLLTDGDIYCDLDELACRAKPGRVSEKEFIYFNSVGLSYVDVALGYAMFQRAKENNRGTYLDLKSDSLF